MLARRFACPPVNEACFELRAIPNGRKDMEGTVILKPTREYLLTLLGEMVQMVNEAVRRRASSVRDASKPLSLEYMADRLDVDDPLTGYLACTKAEGWLQGFITATTFTTWNHGFRWDSTNPVLDLHSMHGEDEGNAAKGRTRLLVDEDGSLSAALQAELHAGDPDDEGVVFPRIAEISLLGALGCGKWLLELMLEGFESADSPYAFVVTQATDGSISFYERMGFVRVGAVTARKRADAAPMEEAPGGVTSAGKKRKASLQPPKQKWEASPHVAYRTEGSDETVEGIAAQHGVSVHDLIFFNKGRYPKLAPDSVLKKDTKLLIPQLPTVEQAKRENEAGHASFWEVPETMPFKRIAETLNIEPRDLLRMNQERIKGLHISSELIAGTKVQIKQPEYIYDEYCHWTFPDDDPALAEPSYMMARPLKPFSQRTAEPGADSVTERSKALMVDERPPVVPSGKRAAFIQALVDAKAAEERRKMEWEQQAWHVVLEDTPFKKEAELLGMDPRHLRDLNAEHLKGLQLSSFLKKGTRLQVRTADELSAMVGAPIVQTHAPLFNRVVQIDGEDDYEYWYVLTYLPDLQWCHVGPLERRGTFGEKPSPLGHLATGRDRWMLVAEDEGGEIDVGAGRCHIMEAIEMMRTRANADTEEWDIVGPAPPGWVEAVSQEVVKSKKKPKADKEAAEGAAGGAGASGGGAGGAKGKGASKGSAGGASSASKAGGSSSVASTKGAAGKPSNDEGAKELERFKGVLKLLRKHKEADPFLEPVDWQGLGLDDYPEVVTHPMDLNAVQARLERGGYADVLEAAADVELIWSNTMLYNSADNWVYAAAVEMKQVADLKLAPLVASAKARLEATSAAASAPSAAAAPLASVTEPPAVALEASTAAVTVLTADEAKPSITATVGEA